MSGEIITVEGDRFPGIRFTDQPDDAIAPLGSTVELKCNARYIPEKLNFGWILNGSELVLSNVVPRKTFVYNLSPSNGNLRIDNISGEAYGVYQCVAKYSGGTIISRKTHVRMPYLYKTNNQPATDIRCNETYPCLLKPRSVVSFPEPSFAWEYRRNSNETFSEIEKPHGGSAMFPVSLEGHLCILDVTRGDQGQYRCRINNTAATVYEVYDVTIGRINMSIKQNNTLSILVKPKNITVGVSSSASFDCIASERDAVTRWLKGDERIDSSTKYDISLPYRLVIKQAFIDDEGWYTCVVSSNFTTVSQKAFLNVRGVVELIKHWPDRQEIVKGDVLILQAIANYGKIQWYWNGQPIDRHFQNGSSPDVRNITRKVTKIGHEIVRDEQTLKVEGMALYNSGIYQVLATGFNRQVSEHTEITSYSCGGTHKSQSGSLSTPNFPESYPRNIECLWIIKPYPKPNPQTLYLQIDHFDSGARSCKDKGSLQIIDGETSTSGMSMSLPIRTPAQSYLSAFRLFFNSLSCPDGNTGFNASYWISGPTTSPTTRVTEPTSFPTERERNGRTTQFATEITTVERSQITTIPERSQRPTSPERSTEKEGSVEESKLMSHSAIMYGVIVFICLTILVIALLLIIKRKGNFILTCIKGNNNDNRREGTERQGHELNGYPSACEIILYDTPGEKNAAGQSTNETEDGPIYDVLEGPGEGSGNPDQSTNVYASVNEVCMSEERPTSSPLGNFEVSFLEEIYTTLTADRGSEDVNIYESLRRGNAGNEQCEGWSVDGMQSTDQDYVSLKSIDQDYVSIVN